MGGQDWPRMVVIACLTAFLLIRLYLSTEKLLEWRIGSAEVSVDADEIMLPSITFCPLKSGVSESAYTAYITTKRSENITTDYNALPQLEDMLDRLSQHVTGKNGTEIIYVSNALLPHYMRIPSHTQYSSNATAMLPYSWDIPDLIQTSVVPTQSGNNIQACMTYNPPGSFVTGYDVLRSLKIDLKGHYDGWGLFIHDHNNYLPSLYTYGSDYVITSLPGNISVIDSFEIQMKDVTYLNDERTPCQSEARIEEMNTCIQSHIENNMRCQLPWHNKSTEMQRCTEPEHYDEFIKSYITITRKKEATIAKMTGCQPPCRRREFEMKLINHRTVPLVDGRRQISGYFYYPTRRYIEKSHFYIYTLGDLIAEMGGFMGLFLGYSALSCYDAFKYLCKKALKSTMANKL